MLGCGCGAVVAQLFNSLNQGSRLIPGPGVDSAFPFQLRRSGDLLTASSWIITLNHRPILI